MIYTIITGLVAGWLTGLALKGKGFGWIGNIIVGLLGAVVGKVVFGILGIGAHTIIGDVLIAAAGAVILLLVIGIARK